MILLAVFHVILMMSFSEVEVTEAKGHLASQSNGTYWYFAAGHFVLSGGEAHHHQIQRCFPS
jgi:hypothetical protein